MKEAEDLSVAVRDAHGLEENGAPCIWFVVRADGTLYSRIPHAYRDDAYAELETYKWSVK